MNVDDLCKQAEKLTRDTFSTRVNSLLSELQKLQEKYDRDKNHGIIREKQEEYNDRYL